MRHAILYTDENGEWCAMVYRRDDPYAQVIIPDHKEIHAGTLRDIIRDAGLSVEEFVDLL